MLPRYDIVDDVGGDGAIVAFVIISSMEIGNTTESETIDSQTI